MAAIYSDKLLNKPLKEFLDDQQIEIINRYIANKIDNALANAQEKLTPGTSELDNITIVGEEIADTERRLSMLMLITIIPLYLIAILALIKFFF